MLANTIRRSIGSETHFVVLVRNDNRKAKPVTLKAICGPRDTVALAITVMLPDED